jgi:hypothetical protein
VGFCRIESPFPVQQTPSAFHQRAGFQKIWPRVCDESGNVIETHEHKGDFKDWLARKKVCDYEVSLPT